MKRNTFTLLILILLFKNGFCQDPYFSQFQLSPMTFNPALLGSDQIKATRISSITRNQKWGNSPLAFATNTISLEQRIGAKSLEQDHFVMGLMLLNERSNGGVLSNTFLSAGLNYRNILDASGYDILSGGLMISYSNRMINLANANFESQFGSFGFMQSSVNYDPISTLSNKYIDMSLGIAYEHKSDIISYKFGSSVFHASKPRAGVYNNTNYSIDPRIVLHGTIKYTNAKKADWSFETNMQMQGTNHLLTIGTTFSQPINVQLTSKMIIGLYERFGESVYPYVGMQTSNWKFGLSYDIIQSEAKTAFNAAQSIEASFMWEFGK